MTIFSTGAFAAYPPANPPRMPIRNIAAALPAPAHRDSRRTGKAARTRSRSASGAAEPAVVRARSSANSSPHAGHSARWPRAASSRGAPSVANVRSSSHVMAVPRKMFPQRLPAARNAGPYRTRIASQDRARLDIGEAQRVAQPQCFPVRERKARQRDLHRLPRLPRHRLLGQRLEGLAFELGFRPLRSRAQPVDRLVADQREQPRAERARAVERRPAPDDRQEDLLADVLGGGPVPD